ncbi:MAG: hypothetical protein O3B74_07560, partial [Proteobacteria bacterium]|nr:hypothetical protein [Pseudomonadota bacterium]
MPTDQLYEVETLRFADGDVALAVQIVSTAADETLSGSAGNGEYLYATGGGDDIVVDAGGEDRLVLNSLTDVVALRSEGADVIFDLSDGGTVRIADQFGSGTIEWLRFADAPEVDYALHTAPGASRGMDWIALGSGDDRASGWGGDDWLSGGAGSDRLNG